MSKEGDPWSYLGLVKIYKVKWTGLICIRKGLGAQIRVDNCL